MSTLMLCIIVPCRNEEGNIPQLFYDLERVKNADEIIFVEGNSRDKTFEEIVLYLEDKKNPKMRLLKQVGIGKFSAVQTAFRSSEADYFAIWDGDNTIPFIDQKFMIDTFLENSHSKVFVTANRLTMHRESNAFRFINLLGNFVFSLLVLLVFQLRIPDVLSGTKIFHRELLEDIYSCEYAMGADPFGDLYLLSRASKAGYKIISIPCKYKERAFGVSNIGRWSGGLAMLKLMLHFALHSCWRKRLIS